MGREVPVDLPEFIAADAFERFRAKARAFLRAHESHLAVYKLRMNKALTAADLAELERILAGRGRERRRDRAGPGGIARPRPVRAVAGRAGP